MKSIEEQIEDYLNKQSHGINHILSNIKHEISMAFIAGYQAGHSEAINAAKLIIEPPKTIS